MWCGVLVNRKSACTSHAGRNWCSTTRSAVAGSVFLTGSVLHAQGRLKQAAAVGSTATYLALSTWSKKELDMKSLKFISELRRVTKDQGKSS
jgi:hypothetical protein